MRRSRNRTVVAQSRTAADAMRYIVIINSNNNNNIIFRYIPYRRREGSISAWRGRLSQWRRAEDRVQSMSHNIIMYVTCWISTNTSPKRRRGAPPKAGRLYRWPLVDDSDCVGDRPTVSRRRQHQQLQTCNTGGPTTAVFFFLFLQLFLTHPAKVVHNNRY